MHTLQPAIKKVSTALRSRNARFFVMNLPRHTNARPAQDRNPLRRSLAFQHDVPAWETNENMCFALWQLMARS